MESINLERWSQSSALPHINTISTECCYYHYEVAQNNEESEKKRSCRTHTVINSILTFSALVSRCQKLCKTSSSSTLFLGFVFFQFGATGYEHSAKHLHFHSAILSSKPAVLNLFRLNALPNRFKASLGKCQLLPFTHYLTTEK